MERGATRASEDGNPAHHERGGMGVPAEVRWQILEVVRHDPPKDFGSAHHERGERYRGGR